MKGILDDGLDAPDVVGVIDGNFSTLEKSIDNISIDTDTESISNVIGVINGDLQKASFTPDNFGAINKQTFIRLVWDDVISLASKFIYRSTDKKTWSLVGQVDDDSGLFDDTSLSVDGIYYYKLQAEKNGYKSGIANSANFFISGFAGEYLQPFIEQFTFFNINKIDSWDSQRAVSWNKRTNAEAIARKIGQYFVLQLDDFAFNSGIEEEKYFNKAGGFAFSDADIFILFRNRKTTQFILNGPGATGEGYLGRTQDGSAGNFVDSIGTPVIAVNGEVQTITTSDNAFDAFGDNFNLLRVQGADISGWTNNSIGIWDLTTDAFDFIGEIAAYVVVPSLTDAQIEIVEKSLLSMRTDLNAALSAEYVTDEIVSAITPDTVGGNDAANTGIDFDNRRNEIVICKFVGTNGSFLRFFDANDIPTFTFERDISAHQDNIQGLAVDEVNSHYYVVGTGKGTYVGKTLVKYDRDGTVLDSFASGYAGIAISNIDFNNGHLWGTDTSNIYKYSVGSGVLTLVETIAIKIRYDSASPITEGFHVEEGNLFILNETKYTKVYDYKTQSILFEMENAAQTQWEGVTMSKTNQKIYVCNDRYFHEAVVNGNELIIYKKKSLI